MGAWVLDGQRWGVDGSQEAVTHERTASFRVSDLVGPPLPLVYCAASLRHGSRPPFAASLTGQ